MNRPRTDEELSYAALVLLWLISLGFSAIMFSVVLDFVDADTHVRTLINLHKGFRP